MNILINIFQFKNFIKTDESYFQTRRLPEELDEVSKVIKDSKIELDYIALRLSNIIDSKNPDVVNLIKMIN